MSTITAGMLKEIPVMRKDISPGDLVQVSKTMYVDEVGYTPSTDNTWYGSGDYKYGNNRWNVEKINHTNYSDLVKYIQQNSFLNNKEEYNMTGYNAAANSGVKEEKITSYNQLKPGDKVRITREIVVGNSSSWDGVRSKDNRTYRLRGAEASTLPAFEMVRLTRLNPEYWPPVKDDVWETSTGISYHASISSYGSQSVLMRPGDAFNHSNLSVEELKKQNPSLKYRKGVKL